MVGCLGFAFRDADKQPRCDRSGAAALAIGRNRPLGEPSRGRHKRSIARQPRSRERPGLALYGAAFAKGKETVCLKKRCIADPEERLRPDRRQPALPRVKRALPPEIDRPSAADRGLNLTLPIGGSRVAPAQPLGNQPGSQRTDPFTAAEVIKDSTADLKRGNCKRCAKLLIEFPNVVFGPRSTDTPARLEVGGPLREWLSAPNQRTGHL